jgi:DUF971 family protein
VTQGKVPWPVSLTLNRSENRLDIAFDNGLSFVLDAEYLRVMTPSAADRGHGPAAGPGVGGRTVAGKVRVRLEALTPIGRYAVRLSFDDGHDTGLYTWALLFQLGQDKADLWQEYLAALARDGLSRQT